MMQGSPFDRAHGRGLAVLYFCVRIINAMFIAMKIGDRVLFLKFLNEFQLSKTF